MTQASAGDSQLLLNILRAKDNIPIHFTDLSVIHGSIQMSASAGASVPVANVGPNPTTVAPLVTGQSAPSFDVGTLDTQDFTRGMLSPVAPSVIKQLFDQGIDPRLIMLLFFSDFRDLNGHLFLNNMACDPLNPGKHPEFGCLNQVYDYLDAIDRLFEARGQARLFMVRDAAGPEKRRQMQANIYQPLRPIGGRLSGVWNFKDNFGDLKSLDATKYRLIDRQVYVIYPDQLAICYQGGDHRLSPLFDISANRQASRDACNKTEVIIGEGTKKIAGFTIRSPYQILQFLGQVLRFQEEGRSNRCLTLSAYDRSCDLGEVLFQVNAPVGAPVIATRYAGGVYAVNFRSCSKKFDEPCDYSLEVLAILQILFNFNKSAKDIVAIPRVQVVQ